MDNIRDVFCQPWPAIHPGILAADSFWPCNLSGNSRPSLAASLSAFNMSELIDMDVMPRPSIGPSPLRGFDTGLSSTEGLSLLPVIVTQLFQTVNHHYTIPSPNTASPLDGHPPYISPSNIYHRPSHHDVPAKPGPLIRSQSCPHVLFRVVRDAAAGCLPEIFHSHRPGVGLSANMNVSGITAHPPVTN